jgi:hypothetical protein
VKSEKKGERKRKEGREEWKEANHFTIGNAKS